MSPKITSEPDSPTEKYVSFKTIKMIGYEGSREAWEFTAKKGFFEKNSKTTYLVNVSRGTVYKEGDIVAKDITAHEIQANSQAKIIEALSHDKKQIKARLALNLKGNKKSQNFANVRADSFSYNSDSKQTTLKGNVKFSNKELRIASGNLVFDLKEEKGTLSEKVKIFINGKQKAAISAQNAVFYSDETKDMESTGGVNVIAGKKAIVADRLTYNKRAKKVGLFGKAKMSISKGKSLLVEEDVKKLKSDEAKKILEEKTLLSADTMYLSTKNGDARAEGNVIVLQNSREAKSDVAVYSDDEDMITLTNNVYIKTDKNWVKCKEVLVSIDNETFDAIGSVEAELKLKR